MKLFKITLGLMFLISLNDLVKADELTHNFGDHLMNAQVIQLTNGAQYFEVSIGHYRFDGNGGVTFSRLHMDVTDAYTNGKLGAKHVNVPIRDLYGTYRPHDLDQDCTMADMGNMRAPISTNPITTGRYYYDNGYLTIDINGVTSEWQYTSSTDRWDLVEKTYANSSISLQNYKGYGYSSRGVGPAQLDFKNHVIPGVIGDTSIGYTGEIWEKHRTDDASSWLTQKVNSDGDPNRAFTLRSIDYSNVPAWGSNPEPNAYSYIWYYNLMNVKDLQDAKKNMGPSFDGTKGAMVQNSILTNYYPAYPTMFFYNVGHIFHAAPKSSWGAESQEAFDSRHCWTDSDTRWTQGHIKIHLGAWDGSKISNVVSVEVSRYVRYFPTVGIGYGKGSH